MRVQGYVEQMSLLVKMFTYLALLTGVMVLITSLLATSQDRIKDSALFRLLGMQTSDLYIINIIEICFLGLSAGLFGFIGSTVASSLIVTELFDIPFSIPWKSVSSAILVLVVILLFIAVCYVRQVIGRGVMARVKKMI